MVPVPDPLIDVVENGPDADVDIWIYEPDVILAVQLPSAVLFELLIVTLCTAGFGCPAVAVYVKTPGDTVSIGDGGGGGPPPPLLVSPKTAE
jgi:hypothetical protein